MKSVREVISLINRGALSPGDYIARDYDDSHWEFSGTQAMCFSTHIPEVPGSWFSYPYQSSTLWLESDQYLFKEWSTEGDDDEDPTHFVARVRTDQQLVDEIADFIAQGDYEVNFAILMRFNATLLNNWADSMIEKMDQMLWARSELDEKYLVAVESLLIEANPVYAELSRFFTAPDDVKFEAFKRYWNDEFHDFNYFYVNFDKTNSAPDTEPERDN